MFSLVYRRLLAGGLSRSTVRPLQHLQPPRILRQLRPRTLSTSPCRHARRFDGFPEPKQQQGPSFFARWVQSPTFYYQIGGAGVLAGGVYISNLEEVPVSGRRRFNIVSEATVLASSDEAYATTLAQYRNRILPERHPAHQMVERVLQRLIPHVTGPAPPKGWKVHVVASDEPNAFVLPGGKVFVMTGILPICAGEDGLAAVLGHEIAHDVAGHFAEKLSQSSIFSFLAAAVNIGAALIGLPDFRFLTHLAIDFGLSKPNSRTQESEADYIGLMLMSEACYDPRAAVGIWERMDRMEKANGGKIPQFMSTHPASGNRMTAIQNWLPKAEATRESGGCMALDSYRDGFSQAFQRWT